MTLMREAVLLEQGFKIDVEVDGLKKELRKRRNSVSVWRWWAVVSLSMAVFFIGAVSFCVQAGIASASVVMERVGDVSLILMAVILSLAILPLLYGRVSNPELVEKDRVRREKQHSLKMSAHVGRDLKIPVLTKEHVDAGIRLDELVSEKSLLWTRGEIELVRNVLFTDLSREAVILSIIEDRDITTPEQVIDALSEMESNGKPLQDGWL
jgi:hypothetical protein